MTVETQQKQMSFEDQKASALKYTNRIIKKTPEIFSEDEKNNFLTSELFLLFICRGAYITCLRFNNLLYLIRYSF